jgi:uncharacterized membrane protein YhaH (DUF805 family)
MIKKTRRRPGPGMKFTESVVTRFRKGGDIRGRASRSEFGWWMLFAALVHAAIGALAMALWFLGLPWIAFPLLAVVILVVWTPTVSVYIRRPHDTPGRLITVWFCGFSLPGVPWETVYGPPPEEAPPRYNR